MLYRSWVVLLGISVLLFVVNYVLAPEPDSSPRAVRVPLPSVSAALSDVEAADEVLDALVFCLDNTARLDDRRAAADELVAERYDAGGPEAVLRSACLPFLAPPASHPFTRAYGQRAVELLRRSVAGAVAEAHRRIDAGAPPDEAWAAAVGDAALFVAAYRDALLGVHDEFSGRVASLPLALPDP